MFLIENFDTIFVSVLTFFIHVLEIVCAIVIVVGAAKSFIKYIKKEHRFIIRIELAKAMALGLEFKLGSEILRTVVVRTFTEILIVGSIIVLCAAMSILIHWEIGTLQEAQEKTAMLDGKLTEEEKEHAKKLNELHEI